MVWRDRRGAPGKNGATDGSVTHPCIRIAILIAVFLGSCAAPDTGITSSSARATKNWRCSMASTVTAIYPVSTSKFGLGDCAGSRFTPLGELEIAKKLATTRHRARYSKIAAAPVKLSRPNAPGRDPIVTRILWLRGLRSRKTRMHSRRDIYIHGTPEERNIGRLRATDAFACARATSLISTTSSDAARQ